MTLALSPVAFDAVLDDIPWIDQVVAARLALPWTDAVVRSSEGRVSARAWRVREGERDRAIAVVHVVHRVNLAAYVGASVESFARVLGHVGAHPLRMDIAFCELPLLHLPGLVFAPDTSEGERRAILEAVIGEVRRTMDVDLLVGRVFSGASEAAALGLPVVPFQPNYVMAATGSDHGAWIASPRRAKVRRNLLALARASAQIRFHDDTLPSSHVLHALYQQTAVRHARAGEIMHPITVTPALLDATAALPRGLRSVCTIEHEGEIVAFSLGLRAGPTALLRTAGVDRTRARPFHVYLALQHAWVELANRWGCTQLDLGPTAENFKARLGATPTDTAYVVDFRRWWLAPLRPLIAARVR